MRKTVSYGIGAKVRGLFGSNYITFEPNHSGQHGIVFQYQGVFIPAKLENVCNSFRFISLGAGGKKVHWVEHVLAALYLMDITDALVRVSDNFLPSTAKSIAPYLKQLKGRVVPSNLPEFEWRVVRSDTYIEGNRAIHIEPLDDPGKLIIDYRIDFPKHGVKQSYRFIHGQTPIREIALARSFIPLPTWLKPPALAYKPLLKTFLISDGKGTRNVPVRYDGEEPIRHKTLDAFGEIRLLQHPVQGHLIFDRAGHSISINAWKSFIRQRSMRLVTLNTPLPDPF